MRHLPLFVLLAVGCNPDDTDPGTVVGNPGSSAARLAPSADVTVTQASVETEQLVWQACDGEEQAVPWAATVDLLANRTMPAPEGDWCALRLVLAGPLAIDGEASDGQPVALTLEPSSVLVSAPTGFGVDGDVVLELGYPDWLVLQELTLEGGTYTPPSGLQGELELRVTEGSALYADDDEDGEVGEAERQAGALAIGARNPGR